MNIEVEQSRTQKMLSLRDHFAELAELIGIQAEAAPVAELSRLQILVEMLFRDEALYGYLGSLDRNTLLAIQKMKDRNLERWNYQENERQQDQMLDERERQIRTLEEELSALKDEKNQTEEKADALGREQENMVRNMITFRDDLLMRAFWIASGAPENANAAKLVDSLLADTGRLLTKMGVEIQEDGGEYDNQKHTIVDTVPAPSEELVDHIFKTVRPGYRFHGNTLRFQEVILYKKG